MKSRYIIKRAKGNSTAKPSCKKRRGGGEFFGKQLSLLLNPLTNRLKNGVYAVKIKVLGKKRYKSSMTSKRIKDRVFYYGFLIVPLTMLVINYFIINGNSVLLAFKSYNPETLALGWAGVDNFKKVLHDFFNHPDMIQAFKNSITAYLVLVIVQTIIPVFFTYYIYKKYPLQGFFKIVLFLPSIISGIVMATVYKFICDVVVPDVWEMLTKETITGLVTDPNKLFNSILFYYIWTTIGGGLLIQLGAMNSVDKAVTEAAVIDGVGFWGEFWHVVLPRVYQIIAIGFILGVVSIFTNDLGMYAFKGTNVESRAWTLGYYFTIKTLEDNLYDFPYLASWGLLVTAVAVPITFLLRFVIYKFGPQE